MKRVSLLCLVLAAAIPAVSCGSEEEPLGPQGVDLELGDPPERLSDMNLMRWTGSEIVYEKNVVPYELNTPLFSDYSLKDRAIFVPEGTSMEYRDNEVFEFPVGTVILKSFMFPADLREPTQDVDLIETRVLGTKRPRRLRPEGLAEAKGFIEHMASYWPDRFDRLDAFLKANDKGE